MYCVYGSNDKKGRLVLWQGFMEIAANNPGQWVILGDFNAIFNLDERIE